MKKTKKSQSPSYPTMYVLSQKEISDSFRKFADNIENGDIKILDIKHRHNRKIMGYNITITLQVPKEIEELKKYTITIPKL